MVRVRFGDEITNLPELIGDILEAPTILVDGEVPVRPCLLLRYLRGWEGIISYPGISPIGCLLVRVLRG
jgi:hypothetical protein